MTPYLIVIGEKSLNMASLGIDGMSAGEISNDELLSDYYAATDAYLLPSTAENSPLTALEALATGVPVISFNAGGVPELIEHRKTGYIAGYRDASDFADGIKWAFALTAGEQREISKKCVEFIRDRHSIAMQAKEFSGIYETCFTKRRDGHVAF